MGENFETGEQRNVTGLVAIHVDDLLISVSEMFVEHITQRMKEKFGVDSYDGNDALYSGMGISKVNNEDFDGIVPGANKYEGAINHIEIPHDRTRTPEEPLAEAEKAKFRADLGISMGIARIARPDLIYGELAAAQTFSGGAIIGFLEKARNFRKTRKKGRRKSKRRKISDTFLFLLNL